MKNPAKPELQDYIMPRAVPLHYNKPPPAEYLAHYGVKGMKWGVRKDRVAKSDYKSKIKTLQFFGKKTSDFKTIRLSVKEYAHVMSEIMTHITPEEKSKDTVTKYIGQYRYLFENFHDGTFRVIGRTRIRNKPK